MNSSNYSFEKFCGVLGNSNILKNQSVTRVIQSLTELISQIKSDVLLRLSQSNENNDYYLDYMINEIQRQDYLKNLKTQEIEKTLKELNLTVDQLINLDYPLELNSIIGVTLGLDTYYDNYEYLRRTQDVLLNFILKYYANKLISLLESKKLSSNIVENISINKKAKVNQLSINQIVLLLDRLGFFTHPVIEKAPKTKQSELISMICGLHPKNIKEKIENLDKLPRNLGSRYQNDLDKIDYILNNLR